MRPSEHLRREARPRTLLAFGFAVTLAGCGGAASPTTPTGSQTGASTQAAAADSCAPVTRVEAAAALGQPVKPPVRGRAFVEGGVACVFYGQQVPTGANPDIPVRHSVRVVLVRGPDAKRFFDDYRSKVRPRSVAGLGDAAYYDGIGSLSVLKGDAYVRIAVIGVPDGLAAARRLAVKAVARM
jgi:hypothetical protein